MRPQQIKRKEDLLPREVLRYTASLSEVQATQANTSINTSKSLASQQVWPKNGPEFPVHYTEGFAKSHPINSTSVKKVDVRYLPDI